MVWRNGELVFPKAQVIDPKRVRAAMVEGAIIIKGRAANLRPTEEGLDVINEAGGVLASGTHIIFALGAGVLHMEMFSSLDLRFSRGQISWAKNDGREKALTYGGYAVPLGDDMLLGATHEQLGDVDPYAVTAKDDALNFDVYLKAVGRTASSSDKSSRAAVRVNTKTTWPFIMQMKANVFALTGLGSRGFVFAPLMADMFVSDIMGEPNAWPPKLKR